MSATPSQQDYDAPVDLDPEGAPTANKFLMQIIGAALVVIVLFTVAVIVDSPILIAIALISIAPGILYVVRAIFHMMSTDDTPH
ncbi:hypothetical protein SK069_05970 [Patulibacter brassicae]|jgi:hypothetical protein|uniref:Uncharacterized protein n=1 Tax=Patulibacter brassicae TaxID=1705717 RepID=A0ABU4VH51_9ACTN|nr:hypothetical protein [Patulibacter brassicae]MDX8151131.1 hypothetical protein [Patulibacter brassicae]